MPKEHLEQINVKMEYLFLRSMLLQMIAAGDIRQRDTAQDGINRREHLPLMTEAVQTEEECPYSPQQASSQRIFKNHSIGASFSTFRKPSCFFDSAKYE